MKNIRAPQACCNINREVDNVNIVCHSDHFKIRNRFLNRLGIIRSNCPSSIQNHSSSDRIRGKSSHDCRKRVLSNNNNINEEHCERNVKCNDNNAGNPQEDHTYFKFDNNSIPHNQQINHDDSVMLDNPQEPTTDELLLEKQMQMKARKKTLKLRKIRHEQNNPVPEKHVQFFPIVLVYTIESHRNYSLDEKKRIWMSRFDIQNNAERNRLKYISKHLKENEKNSQIEKEKQKQENTFRTKSVRFFPDVLIYTIECHRDYTLEEKCKIWMSASEIQNNAERNRMEYIAEGKDWRRSLEENDMWTDKINQEKIHPIHVLRLFEGQLRDIQKDMRGYYHSTSTCSTIRIKRRGNHKDLSSTSKPAKERRKRISWRRRNRTEKLHLLPIR